MLKFADNMDVGCWDVFPCAWTHSLKLPMMLQNAVYLCKVQRMLNHSFPVPLLGELNLRS